jgi:hypothetical protein
MRLGKWVLGLAALGLLFCGTATAQYQPNELCINAGAQTWAGGPGYGGWGFPNNGMGKYFPSFTHWTGTEFPYGSGQYPWKINGWGWNCMQGTNASSNWYWSACLQKSWDNPYDTTVYGTPPNTHIGMGWDYPRNFCAGVGDTGTLPDFIYGGHVPGTLTGLNGNHAWVFPSSYQGFDTYENIFAYTTGAVVTSVPTPFTIWSFAVAGTCEGIWVVPSSHSIYEYVWCCRPETSVAQYLNISAYEYDCTGTAGGLIGNKMGRNYTIDGDYDNGYYWGWNTSIEAGMCLLLCDVVTIPVNVPGSPQGMNPYAGYGFDVGSATVTPYALSGCVTLRFMTQANQSPGYLRVVLAALQGLRTPTTPWTWANLFTGTHPQCLVGWSPLNHYRVPHEWDLITNIMLGVVGIFAHTPTAGFPAQFFASSVGTYTLPPVGFPPVADAHCLELHVSSLQFAISGHPVFPDQPEGEPSASFMPTYW